MATLSLPPYYIIEPTNLCNFHCSICPNSFYENKDKGNMEIDLFDKLIAEICNTAKVIQLYWMGEPLLNKDIFSMIKSCKTKTDAKVILSTNGSHLKPLVIESLVNSGLDEIIISMDSCESQEIYSSIRIGGNICELNSNIYLLLQNKKNMHVILNYIDMYKNQPELDNFRKKWGSQDCTINISCLYSWANQIPSLNLASNNLSPVAKKKRIPCADLWNKMAIHWDGRVSACCFDWNFKLVIGDSKSSCLQAIWNSNVATKLRDAHTTGNYSDLLLCKNCDSWAEPNEYEKLLHLNINQKGAK